MNKLMHALHVLFVVLVVLAIGLFFIVLANT